MRYEGEMTSLTLPDTTRMVLPRQISRGAVCADAYIEDASDAGTDMPGIEPCI